MSLALIGRILLSIPILRFAVLAWEKQIKSKAELERHSVSAEELHDFIGSGRKQAALLDVCKPLDVLAYPELIPGSPENPA